MWEDDKERDRLFQNIDIRWLQLVKLLSALVVGCLQCVLFFLVCFAHEY